MAMIALKKSGRRLKRSVMFLATGGESTAASSARSGSSASTPSSSRRFWAVLTRAARRGADAERHQVLGTDSRRKHLSRSPSARGQAAARELRDLLSKEDMRRWTGLSSSPRCARVPQVLRRSRDSRKIRDLLSHPERPPRRPAAYENAAALHAVDVPQRDGAVPPPAREGGGWRLDVKLHCCRRRAGHGARAAACRMDDSRLAVT